MNFIVKHFDGRIFNVKTYNAQDLYSKIKGETQEEFGVFYDKDLVYPSDILKKYNEDDVFSTRRGRWGTLVLKTRNKMLYTTSFFSTLLYYPYHHYLLQSYAIESVVASNYPKSLVKDLYAVESINVKSSVIEVNLTTLEDTYTTMNPLYKLCGPLRYTYFGKKPVTETVEGLGRVKCMGRDITLISSKISSWGPKEDYTPLDYEIRNLKHFNKLVEKYNPKHLEAYFLDAANKAQIKGNKPDPFFVFDEGDDIYSSLPEGFRDDLKDKPQLESGKLQFFQNSFTWTSKTQKMTIDFNKRVKDLLSRNEINDGDVAIMHTRYKSVGASGQYTMTPRVVIDYLEKNYDIKYEGFGAPFNVDTDEFCSLMFDVDLPFGSMGPFSWKQLVRKTGNWSINPPFTEYIFELTITSIIKACETLGPADTTQFHVLFPGWEPDQRQEFNECMAIMKGEKYSPYLASHCKMNNGEYSFERINGNPLYLIHGGLLYSVFSPSGKNCGFDDNDMTKLRQKFTSTVPKTIRNKLAERKDIPWNQKKWMNGQKK